MTKELEFKSQMESIRDHATQAIDGLLTYHEAFGAIQSIMLGMDHQAMRDLHVRQMDDEQDPDEPQT